MSRNVTLDSLFTTASQKKKKKKTNAIGSVFWKIARDSPLSGVITSLIQ